MKDKIRFYTGNEKSLEMITDQAPAAAFDERSIQFLDKIYRLIWQDKAARTMPDVMSFAFWCRKNALLQRGKAYEGEDLTGRGVCLQFVPSNIPSLFAYSLSAALLAGDPVIVRMPGNITPAMQYLISVIGEALDCFPYFKERILLIGYDHDREITGRLSLICDVRVIWGGDHSIEEIRRSPLKSGAKDVLFGTRHSMAVIDAEKLLASGPLELSAHDFYNDTYLNDQNACASPNIIFWVGTKEKAASAKDVFWKAVEEEIKGRYSVSARLAVQKLESALMLSARGGAKIRTCGNLITRVETDYISEDVWQYTAPGGFFIEMQSERKEDFLPLLTRICQTVTCLACDTEKTKEMIMRSGMPGGYHVAAMGHALDFELKWDGVDLIREMTEKGV